MFPDDLAGLVLTLDKQLLGNNDAILAVYSTEPTFNGPDTRIRPGYLLHISRDSALVNLRAIQGKINCLFVRNTPGRGTGVLYVTQDNYVMRVRAPKKLEVGMLSESTFSEAFGNCTVLLRRPNSIRSVCSINKNMYDLQRNSDGKLVVANSITDSNEGWNTNYFSDLTSEILQCQYGILISNGNEIHLKKPRVKIDELLLKVSDASSAHYASLKGLACNEDYVYAAIQESDEKCHAAELQLIRTTLMSGGKIERIQQLPTSSSIYGGHYAIRQIQVQDSGNTAFYTPYVEDRGKIWRVDKGRNGRRMALELTAKF